MAATGMALLLAGCTVGPKYERATAPTTAKWDVAEPWRQSDPRDATPKGEWWSVFHDDELNVSGKGRAFARIRLYKRRLEIIIRRARQRRFRWQRNFPTLGVAPSSSVSGYPATGRQTVPFLRYVP